MKFYQYWFTVFFLNLISLISIICACLLIYNDKNGWGWFLFIAIIFGHVKKSDK